MASDIGTGTTIAGGTSSTFTTSLQVISLEFTDTWNREAINFSHMGTTGGHDFKPSDLYDAGGVNVEAFFDSAIVPVATAAIEAWTITFPGGETLICNGFLTNYPMTVPFEDAMKVTFNIKFTGDFSGTLLS